MNATRDRDQPARQRLAVVVHQLVSLRGHDPLAQAQLFDRMAATLARDALTFSEAAWLRLACTPWTDPPVAMARLLGLAMEAQHGAVLVERACIAAAAVLANPAADWLPDAALIAVRLAAMSLLTQAE